MTDQECIELLRGDSQLNRARQLFSSWSARIEQAQAQRSSLSPIEMRKMEFQAVEAIAIALTITAPHSLHRTIAPSAEHPCKQTWSFAICSW